MLKLFENNMHRHSPERSAAMQFDVFEKNGPAFDGQAIRRQITILFTSDTNGPKADLLLYLRQSQNPGFRCC